MHYLYIYAKLISYIDILGVIKQHGLENEVTLWHNFSVSHLWILFIVCEL